MFHSCYKTIWLLSVIYFKFLKNNCHTTLNAVELGDSANNNNKKMFVFFPNLLTIFNIYLNIYVTALKWVFFFNQKQIIST